MLLSAVSLTLTLAGSFQASNQFGGSPLSAAEQMTWSKVRPCIASLQGGGTIMGIAAFITKDGYAVTHQSVVNYRPSELVTNSGQVLSFNVVAKDGPSQLTLIKTVAPPNNIEVAAQADATDSGPGFVMAILPTGPLRAEITVGEKVGVDNRTRMSVPVKEIRIEQSLFAIGGALLFSPKGRLIGSVAATLAQDTSNGQQGYQADTNQKSGVQPTLLNQQYSKTNSYLGPKGLIVGYTPTWEVTSKAVSGFLSPERKASYGLLGIKIGNIKERVTILEVDSQSGADQAGLQVNDVILSIDGVEINNAIDFSRATYRLIPGNSVIVEVLRKGEKKSLLTLVGRQLLLSLHQ